MLSTIKKAILDEMASVRARIRWIESHDLFDSHEEQLQFLEHRLEVLGYELAKLG